MNSVALLSACGLLLMATAHAEQNNTNTTQMPTQEKQLASTCNPTHWSMEARGAALLFLHHDLREIYGSGVPTVQLESSYTLCSDSWTSCDRFLLWENVGWSFKTGQSIGPHYHTRLNLIPISVGIEYQIYVGKGVDFYFGIGPSYSFLRITNDDHIDTHHIKRSQFGVVSKTGFRYTFCTNYFIDVFADYQYTRFRKMQDSIQSINRNFSGFNLGAGFGGKW